MELYSGKKLWLNTHMQINEEVGGINFVGNKKKKLSLFSHLFLFMYL